MAPGPDSGQVYAFGQWTIDLGRRELCATRVAAPLGGRAFEVLEALVGRAGELVTKDELLALVWPGAIVEENTLQVHVSAIRKAFGRDKGLVATASGRGYRLMGDWRLEPGRAHPVPEPQAGPLPATARASDNLPAAGSVLVGREDHLRRVGTLLSAYRVVTLAGPGGVGKTRLALAAARRWRAVLGQAAYLVELGSVATGALVGSSVAAVLDIGARPGDGSAEQAARDIGTRNVLLILDNCEHVLDSVAELAETVLRACPGATLLATSREPLRIDGENVFRVPPLDVPPSDARFADRLLGFSAVQLLTTRIAEQGLQPPASIEDFESAGAICRRLDGIPLAIELAASRVAALGLREVVRLLDDRFELLTGGRRRALPRHRTLRATLDWSYGLLSADEQRLLRRLSVFVGGFTLEAAAAVDGGSSGSGMLELLSSLVEKSLVSMSESRWRLLESTRAYAGEELRRVKEAHDAARRHAVFFHAYVMGRISGPSPGTLQGRMDVRREMDNVLAAVAWALSPAGDAALGFELIQVFAPFAPMDVSTAFLEECRGLLSRAMTLRPAQIDARAGLRLEIALELSAIVTTGPSETSVSTLARTYEHARALADANSALRALWAAFSTHFFAGTQADAQASAQAFLEQASAAGPPGNVLTGELFVAMHAAQTGDQHDAHAQLDRVARAHSASQIDDQTISYTRVAQRSVAQGMLARTLWLRGSLDRAREAADTVLSPAEADDGPNLALCFSVGEGVWPVFASGGDLTAARRTADVYNRIVPTGRHTFWQALGSCLNGELAIRSGDREGAATVRDGLLALARAGWTNRRPMLLGVLAEHSAAAGRIGEALETAAEAIDLCDRSGWNWCVPELLRIQGEAQLLRKGKGAKAAAEASFAKASAAARRQGALFWELRVAMSIGRLRIKEDRPADARKALGPVFGRFIEGLDTACLREARSMLDMVAASGR